MAKIICIETATTNCSVALAVDGKVVAIQEDSDRSYSHAEKLHTFIEKVCAQSSVALSDIDAIAVSMGPGSYTGLRIGVSAAKGLCYSMEIPLISISTLESLQYQVLSNTKFVIPMLDARRMEVYSAIYSQNKLVREIKAEVLNSASFEEYLQSGSVTFIGSGVEKFKSICTHANAIMIEGKLPSAYQMAALAEAKHKISDTEDVAYFEPYYLKNFITS